MSAASPPQRRHALGLPAGSIRALLGLGVLAMLWILALTQREHQLPEVFTYLMILMILILAHYFAAHGKTVGRAVSERSALGLPRGSVRFLLLVGYVGLAYYLYHNESQLTLPGKSSAFFLLTTVLLGGFFLGYVLTKVMSGPGGTLPAWFQDIQAWAALLALIGLGIIVIVYTVINPSVSADQRLNVEKIETALAGLIGFYFGARS
jgi:hypothetical protein